MVGWEIKNHMKSNKSKTVTAILIIMIFGLIGTIFYITNVLITPDATKSKIAAKKSKAADITYSKDLSLSGSGQCPDDVKQCPDGSYVSRIPPDCQFPDCSAPGSDDVLPPTPTSSNTILPVTPRDTLPASTSSDSVPTVIPPTNPNPTTVEEPSPTERLLANNYVTSTPSQNESNNSSTTIGEEIPTTTPMSSLPKTGLVHNSIIIFGVSSLFLFLAFLY